LEGVRYTAILPTNDFLTISISVVSDKSPLPPVGKTEIEEFKILEDEPYIDSPIKVDYGTNVK
jgi:hypothetical protein